MTTEARGVSAPDSVTAPTHVMSAEGAARLAALSPDQRQIPTEEPQASTRILDPAELDDQGVTGDKQQESEAPTDPQAERVAPRPEVDTSAIEPLAVSDAYRADAEDYRQDAALIAREHNIPAGEMGALYQFIGTAAAAELANASESATSYQGQVPGPNLADPDACRQTLRTKYGAMADTLMEAARREFHALPQDVQAWLEHHGGDNRKLANHPALIEALGLRPFARLTPDAARAELDRIRQSTDWIQGNPLAVAKVKMLGFVIAGKRPAAPRAPQPNRGIVYRKETPFGTRGGDAVHPGQGTQAAAALRAELATLQAKGSDLFSSDGPKRKRAIARRQEIHAQLEGSR